MSEPRNFRDIADQLAEQAKLLGDDIARYSNEGFQPQHELMVQLSASARHASTMTALYLICDMLHSLNNNLDALVELSRNAYRYKS